MHPTDIIGVMVGDEQTEERGYSPAGRGIFALARGEGTSNHREKGAIDQRIAIDQKEPRAVRTFHRGQYKARGVRFLSRSPRINRKKLGFAGPGELPSPGFVIEDELRVELSILPDLEPCRRPHLRRRRYAGLTDVSLHYLNRLTE